MPYKLSPSGYCVWYHGETADNLVVGVACEYCKRAVAHSFDCPKYIHKQLGESSRAKLFNAASILWAKFPEKSFITFTLPSKDAGIYQTSPRDQDTGDLAITAKFSKVLEAWSLKQKRSGKPLSYVWVAEAQMLRQEKFGGIGDIHFHLVANVKIKHDNGRVCDRPLLLWLQDLWCNHLGVLDPKNSIHVDPIPDGINSIPGYLTKYLGKGSQRVIVSRKFGASRDLTRYKPITLTRIPDQVDLCGSVDLTTKNGYEISLNFFNTRQILEQFGEFMLDEDRFAGTKPALKNFTAEAIAGRADRRTWSRIREAYALELEGS